MKYISIKTASVAAGATLILFGASFNANAFGIPGIGGGESSSSVDTSELVKTSNELVDKYRLSMVSINYAQAEALEAFGLREMAEEARQDAKAFQGGVVDGKAGDKKVENTEKRNEEIYKRAKKGTKLQGQARKHVAKSAAAYAGTSYMGVKIAENIKTWGSDAKGAMSSLKTDPRKLAGFKNDIEPGLFVMTKLPDLASQWTKTASVLVDYAKVNGDKIDEKKEAKAMEQHFSMNE